MKKTDTLADWLHAWTYDTRPLYDGLVFNDGVRIGTSHKGAISWQAKQKLDLRMALRKAERVHLDDAFLREIARKTIAGPPEMLAISNLAMLPFDKMFVEYDDGIRIHAVAEAAKEIGGSYRYDPDEDYGRAGLLFERLSPDKPGSWILTHISDSEGSLPVWPYGAAFAMDGKYSRDDEDASSNGRPFIKNLMLSGWGYLDDGDTTGLHYAIHDELLARGAAVPEPRFFLPTAASLVNDHSDRAMNALVNIAEQAANQAAGKLRWGICILASLACVPTIRTKREGTGHFLHRFRNVPKLSTTHVRIDAKPGHEVPVYDRHFHEATGRHNRRHEVRGHWRVVDTRKKGAVSSPYWMCAHEIAEEDGLYALCGRCQHLLRWIDHHERGDASLGYVFKDGYEVKG